MKRTAQPRPSPALLGSSAALFAGFLLSGASGLIHEVTWMRLLRHVMGNSTAAITTVLCAFMGGLALGSLLAGRGFLRRLSPVTAFGWIEALIGLYCLCLPLLLSGGEPLYRWLYQSAHEVPAALALARFTFSLAALLVPATLMGATLPILGRAVARSDRAGGAVGLLYALNTLGAVAGAAASGFVLIPALGVRATIAVGAAINLAIAATCLALGRRAGAPESERPAPAAVAAGAPAEPALTARARRAVLAAALLSGLAALSYEVAWTRALALVFGSSVYAFSMMLTAFILGLGSGSLVAARLVERLTDPLRWLARAQAGAGLGALAVVPLLGALPLLVTPLLVRFGASFAALSAVEFALTLLVMFVPTFLMGASFPLATRLLTAGGAEVGRAVGQLYAWNTLGSIAGSVLAGFALIPWIGMRATLLAAVLVNGAGAVLLALHGAHPSRKRFAAGVLLAGAAAVLLTPRWDPSVMTSGPFMQARRLDAGVAASPEALRAILAESKLVYYREDRGTTIAVRELSDGERILYVDGKPDASSVKDLPTQILLAQVPCLLHPAPRRGLVIGLASGVTLGSAARHASFERLDCAEIAPAMVEACRTFAAVNGDVLADPRVRIIAEDGRNHLALTSEQYDVIISEPSNPWIAGIADLFTLEFFRTCRDRLADGGIACIWLEAYNIDLASLRSIVRTFQEVFPDAQLWHSTEYDYQLIGVKGALSVDAERLAERCAEPLIAADLRRIDIDSAEELLARLVMGPAGAGRLAAGAPLHTDDNALLEFAAPRILVNNRGQGDMLEAIEACRGAELAFVAGADAAAAAGLREAAAARIALAGHLARARAAGGEQRFEEVVRALQAAAAIDAAVPEVAEFAGGGVATARDLIDAGQFGAAVAALRTVLRVVPRHAPALEALGWIAAVRPEQELRDPDEAARIARELRGLGQAGAARAARHLVLAACLAAGRQFEAARGEAERAAELAAAAKLEDQRALAGALLAAIARGEAWTSTAPPPR